MWSTIDECTNCLKAIDSKELFSVPLQVQGKPDYKVGQGCKVKITNKLRSWFIVYFLTFWYCLWDKQVEWHFFKFKNMSKQRENHVTLMLNLLRKPFSTCMLADQKEIKPKIFKAADQRTTKNIKLYTIQFTLVKKIKV